MKTRPSKTQIFHLKIYPLHLLYLIGNSYFFKKAIIERNIYFFRRATFSEQLLSEKSYFFAIYYFRRGTLSRLHFLFTAALPIYQLVIKVGLPDYTGVLSCWSTIAQSCNICTVYLIRWLHKVLPNNYIFEQVTFSVLLLFKGSYFFNAALFKQEVYFFSRNYFRIANKKSKRICASSSVNAVWVILASET